MACSTSLKTTSGAHIVVKSLARSPPVYLGEEREGRTLRTLFPEVSEEVHHRLVQDTECPLFMSGEFAEVLKRVKSERPDRIRTILGRSQRQVLLGITSGYRTASTSALEVIAGVITSHLSAIERKTLHSRGSGVEVKD